MNPNDKNWPIETLAAHADGELNANDRAEFESWLLTHPESRQELAAQKLFARKNNAFWNKTPAPQPTEAQWNGVLGNICKAVQPVQPSYQSSRLAAGRRWAAAGTTIAAAALVAVYFMGDPKPPVNPGIETAALVAEEPWAVASAEDVDVISIQGDDGWIVVIGQPPLPGLLEMTTVGDVKLEAIVSDADGQPVKPGTLPGDLKKGLYINPADKTTPVP